MKSLGRVSKNTGESCFLFTLMMRTTIAHLAGRDTARTLTDPSTLNTNERLQNNKSIAWALGAHTTGKFPLAGKLEHH